MRFFESSCDQLYDSAVDAFPHTLMRQHATHPINIHAVDIVPFLGVKTLFLRCTATNEDRSYNPVILAKGISYYENAAPGAKQITGSDGELYWLKLPSLSKSDVLVRCNCPDFFWRFNYYDHLDHSLYGKKRPMYLAKLNPGAANPLELPGLCKHLMKFCQVLNNSGMMLN